MKIFVKQAILRKLCDVGEKSTKCVGAICGGVAKLASWWLVWQSDHR